MLSFHFRYQQMLHRNLVFLASIADATPSLIPVNFLFFTINTEIVEVVTCTYVALIFSCIAVKNAPPSFFIFGE